MASLLIEKHDKIAGQQNAFREDSIKPAEDCMVTVSGGKCLRGLYGASMWPNRISRIILVMDSWENAVFS